MNTDTAKQSGTERLHGTSVEVEGIGILLMGPPGSGKSDLALRLIDEGARLIADDYTELSLKGGRLWASAPEAIAGKMEVRGVGLLEIGAAVGCELRCVIELSEASAVERLPDVAAKDILGVSVERFVLAPFEASAPAKLRLIARRVKGDIMHVP